MLIKKINKNFTIDLIATEKKFRGKGIATELSKFCEYYLQKKYNFFKLSALTQFTNHSSIIFYKKNNYKLKKTFYLYHLKLKDHDIKYFGKEKKEFKNKIVMFLSGKRGEEVLKFFKKKKN